MTSQKDAPKVCNSMNHYPLHYLARLDNSPDDFIATILDNTPQEGIKRLRLDNSECVQMLSHIFLQKKRKKEKTILVLMTSMLSPIIYLIPSLTR